MPRLCGATHCTLSPAPLREVAAGGGCSRNAAALLPSLIVAAVCYACWACCACWGWGPWRGVVQVGAEDVAKTILMQTDPVTLGHITNQLEAALKTVKTSHFRKVTRAVK